MYGAYLLFHFNQNSGHTPTETTRRTGLFGPYAMVFSTTTAASGNLDLSFFGNIGVAGWTPIAGRGYVKGTVTGVRTNNKVVSWLVTSLWDFDFTTSTPR